MRQTSHRFHTSPHPKQVLSDPRSTERGEPTGNRNAIHYQARCITASTGRSTLPEQREEAAITITAPPTTDEWLLDIHVCREDHAEEPRSYDVPLYGYDPLGMINGHAVAPNIAAFLAYTPPSRVLGGFACAAPWHDRPTLELSWPEEHLQVPPWLSRGWDATGGALPYLSMVIDNRHPDLPPWRLLIHRTGMATSFGTYIRYPWHDVDLDQLTDEERTELKRRPPKREYVASFVAYPAKTTRNIGTLMGKPP